MVDVDTVLTYFNTHWEIGLAGLVVLSTIAVIRRHHQQQYLSFVDACSFVTHEGLVQREGSGAKGIVYFINPRIPHLLVGYHKRTVGTPEIISITLGRKTLSLSFRNGGGLQAIAYNGHVWHSCSYHDLNTKDVRRIKVIRSYLCELHYE